MREGGRKNWKENACHKFSSGLCGSFSMRIARLLRLGVGCHCWTNTDCFSIKLGSCKGCTKKLTWRNRKRQYNAGWHGIFSSTAKRLALKKKVRETKRILVALALWIRETFSRKFIKNSRNFSSHALSDVFLSESFSVSPRIDGI